MMVLAVVACLLMTGTGRVKITIDAPMLTSFIRNTYPNGIELIPYIKLTDININSIDVHGIHGDATVRLKGVFSFGKSSIPLIPGRIVWNFSVPVSFTCNLKVHNGQVVVPIKGLSFRVGIGPKVSLSVIEAFDRWWSYFSKTHNVLYFRTVNLNKLFMHYFGKTGWLFEVKFMKDVMILKARRVTI